MKQDDLLALSRQLHIEFSKLVTGLTFGGLVFMLSFDDLFLTDTCRLPGLIHSTWYLLAFSSVMGIAHQASVALDPYRVAAHLANHAQDTPADPKSSSTSILCAKVHYGLYMFQLGSFLTSIVVLTLFKAINT